MNETRKEIKKVGIISNNQNLKAITTAKEIYDYLTSKGCRIYLLGEDIVSQQYSLEGCSGKEFSSQVDLIISVGGDGTFLRAARYSFEREIPVMGINVGNLGFLAEIDTTSMYDYIEKALHGNFMIEKRMLIEGKIIKKGEGKSNEGFPFLALNEFSIVKSALDKIIRIKIVVNKNDVASYSADGIIISTPTGSTAYSLSAGGPVVEPTNRVIVVTPICPHTFFNRSLVLNQDDQLEIELESKNESMILSTDGVKSSSNLFSGDIFKVRKSAKSLNLITFDKHAFFKIFREKLLSKRNF